MATRSSPSIHSHFGSGRLGGSGFESLDRPKENLLNQAGRVDFLQESAVAVVLDQRGGLFLVGLDSFPHDILAVVGAAAGWFVRWGSVKLARLEGLEPGFKAWQVFGPPILASLLFAVFGYDLSAFLPVLLLRSAFVLVFVQVIFFDLEHRLILDRVMFPAMAAALLVSLFHQPWWEGLATGLGIGALFWVLEIAGEALFKAEVLGFGDVKLAAFMGVLLGWEGAPGSAPPIVNAIFLGVLLGAVAAIAVGIWRRSMKAMFAYGPYLAAGALVALYQLP